MTSNDAKRAMFLKVLGIGLLALALLGATSLCMKEIPLALFGERATGIVKKVEVIQTSTASKWENKGTSSQRVVSRSSESTFMHISFTTKDGKPVAIKTLATFNTEAKVGDTHPMIYLPSKPENAKIYSAKQLWLPMCVGFVFVSVCSFLGMRFVRTKRNSVATGAPE